MTRDLKPTRHDVYRLVEHYGSVAHLAMKLDVTITEVRAWLDGKAEIPIEHFEALLALVGAHLKERK